VPAGATVTIELFDFGMNRVRTLIHDASRTTAGEAEEVWDGRTDGGSTAKNGVYFYRVTVNGGDGRWGKVMVLQ
jgi:flagellar hook assembly protein FlgD